MVCSIGVLDVVVVGEIWLLFVVGSGGGCWLVGCLRDVVLFFLKMLVKNVVLFYDFVKMFVGGVVLFLRCWSRM